MLNNAVLSFVDGVFLASDSMESLEASLPASMLAVLVMGFFQSVVAYSGTFVAQYHGAGDAEGVRRSYVAGTLVALAAGALSVAFVPLGRSAASLMSANPEVVSRAATYYTIVSFGAVALCGQMAAASYFTGIGRTRLVFWVNVAGNLLNAALDAVLIFGLWGFPALGMAGAAYATVAAMFLQWGALAWFARRDFSPRGPAPVPAAGTPSVRSILLKVLRYGIPSGAYSTLNILSFTIFVFITGRVGDLAFAVSNACFKVNYLLFAPVEGFAIGAATLVGQAQGRGDSAAAHSDAMRTLALGVGFAMLLTLAAYLLRHPILALFAPSGGSAETVREFHSLGSVLFAWMAIWQVFDATDVIISGSLKGAGDTHFVMWWMVAVSFGLWLPSVWLVASVWNTMPALWSTMVLYVVVISIGSAIRWFRGSWRKIRLV